MAVEDITSWIVDLSAGDLDDTFDNAASFAYDGFNAESILQQLGKCAADAGINKVAFLKDLGDCCAVAVMRGNIRMDTLKKTKKEGVTRINELVSRYKIQLRKNAQSKVTLTRETITFVRVMTVMPLQTANGLHAKKIPTQLTGDQIFGVDNLPDSMKFTAFTSLLRLKTEDDEKKVRVVTTLFYAAMAFNTVFDRQINPKLTDFRIPEVIKFGQMGQAYQFIKTETCFNSLVKFGILNVKWQVNKKIQVVAKKFAAKLEAAEAISEDSETFTK